MTVIFGIKEKDKIILGGDRQITDIRGAVDADERIKIHRVNKCLAIATSGAEAVGKALLLDIKERGKQDVMVTEDVIGVLEDFYFRCKANGNEGILKMPFHAIIAGQGREVENSLISCITKDGEIDAGEQEMMLYPPHDVPQDVCNNIFCNNYVNFRKEFAERTVREIADKSMFVSSCGDEWIYSFEHKVWTNIIQ